ncbi:FAD binding domain protein [Thozetella sp. PMI_491]|nr:FAD binding domain protein [Thozetella sp. PMI_491]
MSLLVISTVSAVLFGGFVAANSCKCLPQDPCWPSASDWSTLNDTLSGRLIQFVPPGSVCYQSQPNFNKGACDALIANYSTWSFNSANPASMGKNGGCDPIYPNGTSIFGDTYAGQTGCSVGSLSPYIVNATEASHVQAALKFAKERNLRLNIKNTGHGGELRSSAPNSLSIWTHNMKSFTFHETFQALGCSVNTTKRNAQMAATIGAGMQDGELFKALAGRNAMGTGGTNNDVGVVGWATGGGHGFMTGVYGQGSDNIIQAAIVTPNGDTIIANECQNKDIFWAIRGGGGGTFGVILNVTLKAYPMPKVTLFGLNLAAKNTTSAKEWWKFVAEFHALVPRAQDEGLHGYWSMGGSSMALGGSMFMWDADNTTINRAIAPFQRFFNQSSRIITYTAAPVEFPTFYDFAQQLPALDTMSKDSATSASRLLSREILTQNQTLFADTMEKLSQKPLTDSLLNEVSFSGTMTISSKPVDNSLNPVWRRASLHLIASQSYPVNLPQAERDRIVNDMTYNKLNVLRELDPTSGTYLNEANSIEPGWQWAYFGVNYARLLEIKNKYDPNGLLWCNKCVGSENWVATQDGALCPVWK